MVMIIRLVSFLLVLVFLHLRDASAHTHREIVAAQMGLAGRLVKVEKLDGVPSTAEGENTKLGGRKMMVKEMIQEEDSAIISGAAHQYRRKGILNVECKLRNRTTSPSKKVKMGGFTAFSADYHVPKSHPPKNN
ncbi:hypothetical protein QYF36_002543 [Acer negundo]|nr:hypothetical protein QYF36_002543 [Acer negundo]